MSIKLEEYDWIRIPISRSRDGTVVEIRELPENEATLVSVLKAEYAPLDVWRRVIMAYYRNGKMKQFLTILKQATATDIGSFEQYRDAKEERIALLCILASYYTQMAQAKFVQTLRQNADAKSDEQKIDVFELLRPLQSDHGNWMQLATQVFNRADKVYLTEGSVTWVGKGALLLAQKNFDMALQHFDTALGSARHGAPIKEGTVPAYLGRGSVLFAQGRYAEALDAFRRVIDLHPSAPAECRLGLALCFFKLGEIAMSRRAYERVHSMEPGNVDAMVGLAVHALNERPPNTSRTLELLAGALERDGYHPRALNLLAFHCMYQRQWGDVTAMARRALLSTTDSALRSESLLLLGRAAVAGGRHDEAYNCFARSVELRPTGNPLAHSGLGQMQVLRGERDAAAKSFQSVLAVIREDPDTLKRLGRLHAQVGNKEQALEHLRRVTALRPDDAEACVLFGQLIQTDNPLGALNAYERALDILGRRGAKLPSSLWHNVGALRHSLGRLDDAERAYMASMTGNDASSSSSESSSSSAVAAVDDDGDDGSLPVEERFVTTLYNLARLREAQHRVSDAVALYERILEHHPTYTDCMLRLGAIAEQRGAYGEAQEHFKRVFAFDHANIDAWTMWANLSMEQSQLGGAQKKFEHVVRQIEGAEHDPYAMLALGNIQLEAYAQRQDRHLIHAKRFYENALLEHPRNVYAANGLGIVMAELGYMGQAKQIFLKVREAMPDMPDIWINLGHVYLSQGQFASALQMYRHCLDKFYSGTNAELLRYIARVHWEKKELVECRNVLQRAVHLSPADSTLWFDLALAQQEHAMKLLQTPTRQNVRIAIRELRSTQQTFLRLAEHPDRRREYSTTQATLRANFTARPIKNAEVHLRKAVHLEQQEEQERAQRQAEIDALRAEREAQRLAQEKAAQLSAEEKARLTRDAELKQQEFLGKQDSQPAAKSRKRTRRRKRRKQDDQEEEEDDDQDERGGQGVLSSESDESSGLEDDAIFSVAPPSTSSSELEEQPADGEVEAAAINDDQDADKQKDEAGKDDKEDANADDDDDARVSKKQRTE
jgi:RNA polymerase-associated protein CTR9